MPTIEAIIAVYGVKNPDGEILTHEAALSLFNQLREQETMPADQVGYYLNNVRMEGDEHSGQITATFKFE